MVCPVQAVPAAEEPRAAWHRPADMNTNLLDFDLDGLAAYCEQLGEKRFRATQLFRWIHQRGASDFDRSEEHTSELQSHLNLVCRLLLEKKKQTHHSQHSRLSP